MGNSFFLILSFMLMPYMLYGQIKGETKGTIFYDVTNHSPIFKLFKENGKLKVDYYNKKGVTDFGFVKFKGGHERLNQYCDSAYFANFTDSSYNEIRGRALYSVLFDNKLKIHEIHIFDRLGYKNDKFDYDKLVKNILFSTEGQWLKESENNWYLFISDFRIK